MRRKITRVVMALMAVTGLYLCLSMWWLHISYLLRPVWDSAPRPWKTFLTHYYSENLTMAEQCALHGWQQRSSPRRVFDAILFSNEVDILEVRWQELDPVTTGFILVESDGTFTGLPKPRLFGELRSQPRFAFAATKLTYVPVTTPGRRNDNLRTNPFDNELAQRRQVNEAIVRAGLRPDDLLVMSDADEIPSRHTVDLLRNCDGFPSPLHLQMRNYLYSFQFLVDSGSWRASVHVYKPGFTAYAHSRQSDAILADAGWHCSFCLRSSEDVAFKMRAYSHADRVRSASFLDKARIQQHLCEGSDLFEMLPEEYTFRELFAKMGPVASTYSAVNLPSFLLKNAQSFKFLLPGNCIRD